MFDVGVQLAVTYCVPVGRLHCVHIAVPGDPNAIDEPGLDTVNPERNVLPVAQVAVSALENKVFDDGVHKAVTYCLPVG